MLEVPGTCQSCVNAAITLYINFSSMNGSDGVSAGEDGDNDGGVVPTREDLVAMVEKDVAFSSPQNRVELFNLIRKLTCEDPPNPPPPK